VALRISPKDAAVEVDGAPAEVRGGTVEIPGALGSSHKVRVVKGRSEQVTEVFVTDKGAIPPQVDLVVGRPPAPPEAARAAGQPRSTASARPPVTDGGPRPIEEEDWK
jgi:serine/threonine-protein kinase